MDKTMIRMDRQMTVAGVGDMTIRGNRNALASPAMLRVPGTGLFVSRHTHIDHLLDEGWIMLRHFPRP
jgi:hypothetical protein